MKNIRYILAAITISFVLLFCSVNVFAAGENLAYKKTVAKSGEQAGNEASHLVDGSMDTRWSVQGYGNSATIDLGTEYYLGYSLIYPHENRQYEYKIEVSSDDDNYVIVADKTDNKKAGNVYFDDLGGSYGRYVKLTVTGGNSGSDWVSILEFEIYGIEAEANWSLGATVSKFSAQQPDESNYASNIIDGDDNTRWSAQGYPNYVVIDLGQEREVSRLEVKPMDKRAYEYKIEASLDGLNYTQIVDETNNSISKDVYVDEIEKTNARFIRLTVTGYSGGEWISIFELRIIGAYINGARPITNTEITRSGKTVQLSGSSTSLAGGEVTLVVAVFDGDKMVEVKTANVSYENYGDEISGSVTLTSDLTDKTIEAFVWDNDASMMSCSDTIKP